MTQHRIWSPTYWGVNRRKPCLRCGKINRKCWWCKHWYKRKAARTKVFNE